MIIRMDLTIPDEETARDVANGLSQRYVRSGDVPWTASAVTVYTEREVRRQRVLLEALSYFMPGGELLA